MILFTYQFLDGKVFRILDLGFSDDEISKLSSLHGPVMFERCYFRDVIKNENDKYLTLPSKSHKQDGV